MIESVQSLEQSLEELQAQKVYDLVSLSVVLLLMHGLLSHLLTYVYIICILNDYMQTNYEDELDSLVKQQEELADKLVRTYVCLLLHSIVSCVRS